MALKAVLTSLDGVDEGLHALYREENGKYVLDLDDNDIKSHPSTGPLSRALERERAAAREAAEKAKALEEQFGDLDPEAAREAIKAMREQGEKELMDEGKIEELIQQRTERMRQDFERQIAAKDKALEDARGSAESLTSQLADIRIYDAVKDAALSKGARKEALTDIANRAREIWRLEDGKPVARQRGDENPIHGKSGDLLTIDEWVDSLSSEAGYLFEPNSGGGASGGDQSRAPTGGVKQITPGQAGNFLEQIASGEAVINRG